MRASIVLSILFSAATVVYAQTPAELAAQIPHSPYTGCGLINYACHCTFGDFLRATIVPCLQNNSTCTAAEIQQFAAIPPGSARPSTPRPTPPRLLPVPAAP
ncbi:hypothetical protein W97_03532 [Coniosporium apollinis CBS 100218]|uniref:Extracellular membrane protein CFEM domain-containing protein n=1 Tax=Coniosporium apollinis (strain CBS 100218) TaxID=1168221 RepID=R7YRL7_CONA1|nr:uncharacterized protein W97_03532 [Coniosporium apollinis CBS 100218]EON64301.1 hypothetical protein W97_03532 [Coniosporium apollinis CBS 100218]